MYIFRKWAYELPVIRGEWRMIQLTRPLPQVIIILHASRSCMLTNAGFGFECDASGEGVCSPLHPLLCKAILHIIITGVIDCARYISKNWKRGSKSAPATMHGRVAGSKATTRWQACGQRLGLSQQLRRQLVLRNTLCKGCLQVPPSPSCWVCGPNPETELISLQCCHMGEMLKALNDQHGHLAKMCTKITLTNLQIEAMKPETN